MDASAPLPSVTVLVIAYRMRATIAASIASALAQTLPCEIIVSDDSSPDGTFEAAQAAVAGYAGPHRVSVRQTAENRGLCAHLYELAQLASGPVLVCLAGDDIAYPQRAQRLSEAMAAHPHAQVIGSQVDDIDVHDRVLARGVRGLPEVSDQRWFLRRGKLLMVLGASMALRRTLLTDLPPLQGAVEDTMLSLRAALVGECRCLPEALIGYRRHDHNLNDFMNDRSDKSWETYVRRTQRLVKQYRVIADDQQRCVAARPDLPEERRHLGLELARMYRLEADMRDALIALPRWRWLGPLWRGLCHPGLRRKSAERAFKLLLPRRWFGRSG
ncbi:MAG: glycosyltransferase [Proteobacteria bacterium]|nr:glycosyltransferase [Pseudomonadota bacterium]MBS0463701.1 glycosyltransferase [Pseudomonadota bacterium]